MSIGAARLREESDVIRRGCVLKGEDPALVDEALVVDAERRDLLGKADALRNQRKSLSDSIGEVIKGGAAPNGPEVSRLREQSNWIGAEISGLDARLALVTARLDELLLRIPNPPDPGVPEGGEEASLIVRTWGEPLPPHLEPQRDEQEAWVRKPHWEIAEALGMIDLAAGAKITGSGFAVYKGAGAALQRALIDFFLDLHTREHGMTEIWPPVVVNEASARGTGQIPTRKTRCTWSPVTTSTWCPPRRCRSPTSIATRSSRPTQLPIRYVAYSPCFRREAGAAGARTRGILRVHQFDKVEMVAFEKPGRFGRHPGVDDDARGDLSAASWSALPRQAHGHRRHGLHAGQEVRPGGLGAGRGGLAGGQLGLQLPRLPGPPHEHPLAA